MVNPKKMSKSQKNKNANDTKGSMSKIAEDDESKAGLDEELNSGFGNYLRSSEGS